MLKGLAITPPVLGRISIGKVIEKNGKRLPEKDDQFTITSQVQGKNGWLLHPLNDELRNGQEDKLRSIPVRLLFNEPELNFRADYTLFDRQSGRPLCVGNGETCKRITQDGKQSLPCPSPDGCSLAQGNACKPYGRLNVVIGDDDPLGTFVFRTTGFNSIRTLAARLQYFSAISGNRLACLPLELRLRGKSTRQSHGTPIFYVDITVRSGLSLEDALLEAKQLEENRRASGFDQSALDQAAQQGFSSGAFEDSEEDTGGIVEEFFHAIEDQPSPIEHQAQPASPATPSLAQKLESQATRHNDMPSIQ
ncbi:hydrolase or metal-binding protein [Pseudomonas lundensis]|uniref:recombination directionality factor n=1 Tax=Pseudomonas lundensis TaxID=86185 RepID=UPI00147617B9|nr:hydrolase or metal-binding protein [Pseudomonas lundensis]NNA03312.1 hydrolase or metal-binding protein [Pseudomonas lundensis]